MGNKQSLEKNANFVPISLAAVIIGKFSASSRALSQILKIMEILREAGRGGGGEIEDGWFSSFDKDFISQLIWANTNFKNNYKYKKKNKFYFLKIMIENNKK